MEILVLMLVILAFCSLLVGGVIYFLKKDLKKSKKKKQDLKNTLKNKNATIHVKIPHINGLSIPEDAICNIYSCENLYEFEANGVSFKLNKEKILDVSLKDEVEIQKQKVSSIGRAMLGEKLFGDLGAIIGGRAKTHQIKTKYYYLIFTYQKDNAPSFIIFDATGYPDASYKFVSEFKENNKNTSKENLTVEL